MKYRHVAILLVFCSAFSIFITSLLGKLAMERAEELNVLIYSSAELINKVSTLDESKAFNLRCMYANHAEFDKGWIIYGQEEGIMEKGNPVLDFLFDELPHKRKIAKKDTTESLALYADSGIEEYIDSCKIR